MNTTLFNITSVAEAKILYTTSVKPSDRPQVSGARDAYKLLSPFFEEEGIEHHEAMFMLMLNRANKVLGCIKISQGSACGTVCDPKQVFQPAILANACGIILAHNHPSGNLKPSQADLTITKKIKDLGVMLELPLLDHLILSPEPNSYYSMQEEGVF